MMERVRVAGCYTGPKRAVRLKGWQHHPGTKPAQQEIETVWHGAYHRTLNDHNVSGLNLDIRRLSAFDVGQVDRQLDLLAVAAGAKHHGGRAEHLPPSSRN